jgi:hypothetical protein
MYRRWRVCRDHNQYTVRLHSEVGPATNAFQTGYSSRVYRRVMSCALRKRAIRDPIREHGFASEKRSEFQISLARTSRNNFTTHKLTWIEQVPCHRSTFLPASTERTSFSSTPTSGDRHSAARIPPFFDWPEMVRLTSGRIRLASGSSCDHFLARDRIRSRSISRPRTSNLATPFCCRRLR